MSEIDDRIRERAYRLWEAEGSPEGREFEHWAQAEKEIAAEDAKAAETKETPSPIKKKS